MPDSSITKREAWGGGIIAAALAIAVPVVQAWAEGQRQDAAGAEAAWYLPIISQQFDYSKRLETQIERLERSLERCRARRLQP